MNNSRFRERTGVLAVLVVIGTMIITATMVPLDSTLGQVGDGEEMLVSLYVEDPPTLDGNADEAIWADAEELVVSVSEGGADGDIKMRSVFTETDIFIYAEWEDPTMSLTRGSGAWEYNPIPEDTMRASYTTDGPVVDGHVSDEVWASAAPLTISVDEGTMPGDITLKALYNDTHIFVQKRWDDPTLSMARGGSWLWDGVEQMWRNPEGQSEDRANIQWDIDATGFPEQGCAVKCHVDSYSYLNNPDDVTDMWHMKAARSLPANDAYQVGTPILDGYEAISGEFHLDGWTDDKHVTYDENEGAEADGGRHGDEGSSTYSRNRNATKDAPKFIETDPDDWIDAMVLLQSEIDGGEAITADPADPSYDGPAVETAWDNYDGLGAVVPERILHAPEGSRGDIHEAAIWKDGTWTVELERQLVTGNEDDVQFDDMGRTYHFGVSTIDNGGGEDHNVHQGSYKMDFASDFSNLDGGSEDRLALLWEIGTISNFATLGCTVKCHPTEGEAGAFLEIEGEMGDIWHMKAARSLPVKMAQQEGTPTVNEAHEATSGTFTFEGFIDDKHLTYDEEPHEGDGGRHGDDGSSTYGRNRNPARSGPLYIETDPVDYLDAMVLTQSEIDGGEAVEVASATRAEMADAWSNYQDLGAVIPERILSEPSGSRADIRQAAVWEDGTWSTEITRKLLTGNDDDVQFDDLDAVYRFGVSLMDDSGGDDHSTSGVDTFLLGFYMPPTEYVLNVGPLSDKDGNPVEGSLVTLEREGSSLSASTGADGNASITVPAEWADGPVNVTITKDGYEDVSFTGVISTEGEFSPTGGAYPGFNPKEKEDESPGFATSMLLGALVVAMLIAVGSRRIRRAR